MGEWKRILFIKTSTQEYTCMFTAHGVGETEADSSMDTPVPRPDEGCCAPQVPQAVEPSEGLDQPGTEAASVVDGLIDID